MCAVPVEANVKYCYSWNYEIEIDDYCIAHHHRLCLRILSQKTWCIVKEVGAKTSCQTVPLSEVGTWAAKVENWHNCLASLTETCESCGYLLQSDSRTHNEIVALEEAFHDYQISRSRGSRDATRAACMESSLILEAAASLKAVIQSKRTTQYGGIAHETFRARTWSNVKRYNTNSVV